MQVPGTAYAFVGLSNGELRELTIDRLVPTTFPASRTFPVSGSSLGATALDIGLRMLYVSDTGGRVYGIAYPIP